MTLGHTLLALLTVSIWGSNFVVVRLGLEELPPILLGVLRFALSAFPLILFYRLPRRYWRPVALYGVLQFFVQFASMYSAMALGMPAGLTSLIVQSQALFTVVLAAGLLHERVRFLQWLGLGIALLGLLYAGWNVHHDSGAQAIPMTAFLLAILGALGWGAGNVQLRRMATTLKLEALPPLALMSWAAALAVPPLLALSLATEGLSTIMHALSHASWVGWLAAAYQAYGNTLLGYGIWSWLIGLHGAVRVAPYSLLVPVVGLSTASWFLDEPLVPWKIITFALLVSGLAINQYGALRKAR